MSSAAHDPNPYRSPGTTDRAQRGSARRAVSGIRRGGSLVLLGLGVVSTAIVVFVLSVLTSEVTSGLQTPAGALAEWPALALSAAAAAICFYVAWRLRRGARAVDDDDGSSD